MPYKPPVDLIVRHSGVAIWRGRAIRCAVGRAGVVADKREGDGATPAGRFAFRRVLYRPDRLAEPRTGLDCAALAPDDAWCDDPGDPAYNTLVRQPFSADHETLWRDDGLYDVIVVLGHNDAPATPGLGSAIFLHVAAPDFAPTEGCIALARDDLLAVLQQAIPGDGILISEDQAPR